jgi:hypothetical protein
MMNTIERTLTSANDAVTERLDSLEQSLPEIPSKAVAATRASVRRVNDAVGAAASSVWSRAEDVGDETGAATATTTGQARAAAARSATTIERGVKQTTGQARAAAERTVDSVSRGVKETAGQARSNATKASEVVRRSVAETRGQARAQARRTADAVGDNVEGALDDAKVSVDPSDLSQWSKSELYERAQELDIDGRSSMSKAELISGIQQA